MAFQSIRHVPIFTIWSAAVLGVLAPAAHQAWNGHRIWDLGWVGLSGLLVLPTLMTVAYVGQNLSPVISTRHQPLGQKQPFGVAAFLKANHLQGRLYTPLWWGSYFSWELHPDILVSCDGRNVTLFSPQTVSDNLSYYHEDNPDPEIPLAGDAELLVLPSDTPVLSRLRSDSRWGVLYEDPDALLLARRDGRLAGLLKPGAKLSVPLPAQPEEFPWRRQR